METIYDLHNGVVDDPHRHNFYTILLVEKAKGQHIIDFNAFNLGSQQVFFISPGQVHQVIEETKSIGHVLTFNTEFLVANNIALEFIDNLNLFYTYGYSPPLESQRTSLRN